MSRLHGISAAAALAVLMAVYLVVATSPQANPGPSAIDAPKAGAADGLRAFRDVASVLVSPRCLNCHVPGDSPLQGDEGRPHNMNVKRAGDGRGTPAMRCGNCHQSANFELAHAPPGAPDWRLPDSKTRMAWQGLSIGDLCRTLSDSSKNGGRSISGLVEHVKSDTAVKWAWNPGPGRTVPPLSHQLFVDKLVAWANGGAPCEP